jgi:hypothetical protein
MPTRSGQSTSGKKSSPSQGKIKGFFKIAGSPAAMASAQCWQLANSKTRSELVIELCRFWYLRNQ